MNSATASAMVVNCIAYGNDGCRGRPISFEQISDVLAEPEGFVWVGLHEPDAALLDRLQEETQVGGQFDIWLSDPEGQSNVPLVTHGRSDEHPTWSPDSRKLAFQSTRRGRADIWVMNVSGSHEQARRVSEGGENTDPAWVPYRR